ncbi:unnamed protein product [Brassica rapa subsp. trilocularis]
MIIFVCVLVWKAMSASYNQIMFLKLPMLCFFRTNITCNNLLRELRKIWVEIGESEAEKDRMLMELERECLQIYQRKVDEAANSKAQLHQIVV